MIRLADPEAERARAEHHRALVELQRSPLAGALVVRDVLLPDGEAISVPHGLGRVPVIVIPSCVRGASTSGHIEEVRAAAYAGGKYVVLRAAGWGADITVDLLVA